VVIRSIPEGIVQERSVFGYLSMCGPPSLPSSVVLVTDELASEQAMGGNVDLPMAQPTMSGHGWRIISG